MSLHPYQDPEDAVIPELTTERAYVAAGPREFAGMKLQAWSGRRRAATFEIGFAGTGSVLDPVRVLYCCAIDPKDVDAVFRNPIIATEKFIRWAEANKCLEPTMPNWQNAFDLANEIIDEVEKSQFVSAEPIPQGGAHALGNSTGHQS